MLSFLFLQRYKTCIEDMFKDNVEIYAHKKEELTTDYADGTIKV